MLIICLIIQLMMYFMRNKNKRYIIEYYMSIYLAVSKKIDSKMHEKALYIKRHIIIDLQIES